MSENPFRVYVQGVDAFGADGYPHAWHLTIKHLVREQAWHRCVRCGHPFVVGHDGEWSSCDERCRHDGPVRVSSPALGSTLHRHLGEVEETAIPYWIDSGFTVEAQWRVLTVHHLDGVKSNCRWWNLAALCQRCHLSIQSRVVMNRRWDKPHTEWFQPYVAGYYAWWFRAEELTRDEVLAQLDDLLALEHLQQTIGGL